ncbi:PspC domain-containing protein [Streptomyces chiangmaiensis]|uniref:PspC domain-containing protein n=1 Tax=Streptomyces chiangmaiensis TaxID=766497 RepID=A0ABU7FEZ6_9ACTN|nr:PspC domain-containing protein [Streptomyces chiangmaiensis]MED7822142.1 PspC domain-containing protein [Streptomyces chiangmaiensis]
MTDQHHAAPGRSPGPEQGPAAGHDPTAGRASHAHQGADPVQDLGRFRRDRRHKMLGGVCAGLGRQCDMDPVIFRIVLAVLSATGGLGLIFYGFVWLLVPYEDEEENEIRKLLTGRVDGQGLAAILFALVGCGVLLSMLRNGGVLTFATILSLLLAGAGYWSRQRGAPDPDPLAAQAVADAPPEATAPPVPDSHPSWWRDPIVKDGTHVGGTGYLWGPGDTPGPEAVAAVGVQGVSHGRQPRAEDRPRSRGPRWIGGWTFLLALLAGGLGTDLTWDDQALGTSLQTGLACALVVLGAGIAVSSFLGRTGAGSLFLAILTAGLLATSVALPKDISTHWTRTTWAPASAAAVRETYDLGTGVGTLDLSRLDVPKGQTVTTHAEVGVGRLKVVVPKDATVKLRIDTGLGDIQLPGESEKDVNVQPDRHEQLTLSPTAGTKNTATLNLGLEVGVGQVEVTRAAS